MTLGERLQEILDDLPAGWTEAGLVLTIVDEERADRAALVLGSLTPGRAGSAFRLRVAASGGRGGPSVDTTRRALDRLEGEGIDARLAAPEPRAIRIAPATPVVHRADLAPAWDELVATLPADWSDAYLEVELGSTDDIDRAALLLGPANPFLIENGRPSFRFRGARRFGYGAAPSMIRRVLARLDEAGIAAHLRLLRVLSDTHPVHTQGPTWRESGRAV